MGAFSSCVCGGVCRPCANASNSIMNEEYFDEEINEWPLESESLLQTNAVLIRLSALVSFWKTHPMFDH